MNGPAGIQPSQADDERAMDPRDAVTLLEQTTRATKRAFDYRSLRLTLVAAPVIAIVFGVLWYSVRNQHPYKGPTPAALAVMYTVLALWITFAASAAKRASEGLSGRSIRQQRAFSAILVAALVGVSVFEGLLKADGVSNGIAYGIYPPTAQLIVLGTIGAAMMAARDDWPGFGVSFSLILLATGSAFAGPRGVWLSDGIGCFVIVIAGAIAKAWMDRPSQQTA